MDKCEHWTIISENLLPRRVWILQLVYWVLILHQAIVRRCKMSAPTCAHTEHVVSCRESAYLSDSA